MVVLVGGKEVEVAVSAGVAVLIGSKVVEGMDVSVGVEGWKGVAVAVEFGARVTRLKSGVRGVGAIWAGTQEARVQITRTQRARRNFVIDTNS